MKFSLFNKKKTAPPPPRHIAIIMDGNRRWAKRRGLPGSAGYAAGAETFRRVATYCKNIGVEYLTVYAFSTENWKRPADEVSTIMELLEKYLIEAIGKMERDRVKMKFFGDTDLLSNKLKKLITKTEEISSRFEGVQVNICLNYGGRDEIIRAVQSWHDNAAPGERVTAKTFENHLFSKDIPDPELVIRPGGEYRISNFLLWQSAYAEYYFTDTMWPDFSPRELDKAIEIFAKRERRYGK